MVVIDRSLAAKLAKAAASGDKAAFDSLRKAFEKQILGYIRTRSAQDADAEDVAQDTWVAIFRKINRFDATRASLQHWLYLQAHYCLLKFYRGQRDLTRVRMLLSELEEAWAEDADAQAIADRFAHQNDPQPDRELVSVFRSQLLPFVFRTGGYPWQVVAFGFKVILGSKPRQVVEEHGRNPLSDAESDLEGGCVALLQLSPPQIAATFRQLRQRLGVTIEDVLDPRDSRTREHVKPFITEKVGVNAMVRFCQGSPERNVSAWCDHVKDRLIREALRSGFDFVQPRAAAPPSAEAARKGCQQ